jgi:regulator of RNase E activity RraA
MTVMDSGLVPLAGEPDLIGVAVPILTRGGDNLAIHRALDDVRPGDVLVINGQGDIDRALLGDLIGEIMVSKGVRGAIVDGSIRDGKALGDLGLTVYARAATPAGPFKHGPGRIGFPVAVGGQVVHPGDIIVADHDGVVVVALDRAAEVIARTAEVLAMEAELRERIRAGASR